MFSKTMFFILNIQQTALNNSLYKITLYHIFPGDFDGQFVSFIAIVFDMTDKDLRMDADHWKIDEQHLSISSNAYPSKFTVLKNFLKTVILRSVVVNIYYIFLL